jgi:hypothetical protein
MLPAARHLPSRVLVTTSPLATSDPPTPATSTDIKGLASQLTAKEFRKNDFGLIVGEVRLDLDQAFAGLVGEAAVQKNSKSFGDLRCFISMRQMKRPNHGGISSEAQYDGSQSPTPASH